MSTTQTPWAVTQIAHPGLRDVADDCQECLAQVQSAVTMAMATGSKGATYVLRGSDGTEHSATVARAIQVILW